jgi:hypothetical protein
MSSDPIAELGRTLGQFAGDLAELFRANGQPRSGTPAGQEADGEPYAGDWGAQPSFEIMATIALASASCADYLTVTARTLEERTGMYSLYALIRCALEVAAQGCYLTEPGIEPLERVRRHMNMDLHALYEDSRMLRKVGDLRSVAKADRHAHREQVIGRVGMEFELPFTAATDRHQAHLGKRPPPVMKMIEGCLPDEPALKCAYQLLSGVAHGLWHGHSRLLGPGEIDTSGKVGLGLRIGASALARDLAPAPLCASVLASRLGWYTGWDCQDLNASITMMSASWERIARPG